MDGEEKKKKEKNKMMKPVYNGNLKGQIMFSPLWMSGNTAQGSLPRYIHTCTTLFTG